MHEGHGFSRAAPKNRSMRALAPEVRLFSIVPRLRTMEVADNEGNLLTLVFPKTRLSG